MWLKTQGNSGGSGGENLKRYSDQFTAINGNKSVTIPNMNTIKRLVILYSDNSLNNRTDICLSWENNKFQSLNGTDVVSNHYGIQSVSNGTFVYNWTSNTNFQYVAWGE